MGWLGGDDFSGRNKLNERDGTMNMKRWTVMVAVMGAVATLSAVAVTHNILTSYQTAAGSLTGTASVTSDTEQNADVTMTSGGDECGARRAYQCFQRFIPGPVQHH